jgi:hypothetical protein
MARPLDPPATPTLITGHRSNAGAIAGSVGGGMVAIFILVAALFFYHQRRRSPAQSAVFEGDITFDPHIGQVQQPMFWVHCRLSHL